jgi:20S proteasome alpha/beta subunit
MSKTWLKFGSTAIGIKTQEGVVLGVEKKLPSKLMEATKSEKLVEVSTYDSAAEGVSNLLMLHEWKSSCIDTYTYSDNRSIVTVGAP